MDKKIKPSFENTIRAAKKAMKYRSRLFNHLKESFSKLPPEEVQKELEKLTTILSAKKYDQSAGQVIKFSVLAGFTLTPEEAKLIEHPIAEFTKWIMNYDCYALEKGGSSKTIVGRFHSIFDLGIQDNISKVVLEKPKPSELISEEIAQKAKVSVIPFYSEIIFTCILLEICKLKPGQAIQTIKLVKVLALYYQEYAILINSIWFANLERSVREKYLEIFKKKIERIVEKQQDFRAYAEQIDLTLASLDTQKPAEQFAGLVLQAFAYSTGWIELRNHYNAHLSENVSSVVLTEKFFEAYPQLLYTLTKGTSLPMVIPPKPWSRTQSGGYLHLEQSIKLRKELQEAIQSGPKYKRFTHEDLTKKDISKVLELCQLVVNPVKPLLKNREDIGARLPPKNQPGADNLFNVINALSAVPLVINKRLLHYFLSIIESSELFPNEIITNFEIEECLKKRTC